MNGSAAIVVRASLGRRLKAARVNARKSVVDVTSTGVCSKAKLARIEAGQQRVQVGDVRALGWCYGLSEEEIGALADMALNTAAEGWWEDYGDVLPSWFSTYVELESAAVEMWCYEPELVPGLLQVPAYTRAVAHADLGVVNGTEERVVELRAERQRAAFARERPLQLRAVLGAGCLTRQVGGSEVMTYQQQQLLRMTEQTPNADIRVLTWGAGAHAAMQGAFVILAFADEAHPDVVYLETKAGARYLTKENAVADYRRIFESIERSSSPMKEFL